MSAKIKEKICKKCKYYSLAPEEQILLSFNGRISIWRCFLRCETDIDPHAWIEWYYVQEDENIPDKCIYELEHLLENK